MVALALALLVLVLCLAWFMPRGKLEWSSASPVPSDPEATKPSLTPAPAAANPPASAPAQAEAQPAPQPSAPADLATSQADAAKPGADPLPATMQSNLVASETAQEPKGLKLRLIPELKLLVQDRPLKPEHPAPARAPDADAPAVARAPAATHPRGESSNKASAANPVLAGSTEGVKQIKPLSAQQRAENEYRRALQAQQQGRLPEAMAALEQALQIDRQHTAARQTLVAWLLEQGQREQAMRHLKDALAHDPGQAGLAMILARLQVDQGQVALALATLQRSLPYTLEGADYHAFMAALLQRQQNHKGAIEHYQIALRLQPEHALWWMGIGMSYQAERQHAAAREAFVRAKNNPGLTPGFNAELQAFVEQKLSQLP
jgi:MSHA biogenesis protein MshN